MNPRTIIVAKDGTGDYDTIQSALDAAQPGDVVHVRKGVYTENLHLRQGVALRGEGSKITRIGASARFKNVLNAENVTNVAVSDMFIDGAGKLTRASVYVNSSIVEISGCKIAGASSSGVEIKGKGSRITIRRSIIRNNRHYGVRIHEYGEGIIENSLIAENKYQGIAVMDQGKVTARANTIRGSKFHGVLISEDSEGVIEDNIITENGITGLFSTIRSKVRAKANTIVRNGEMGVFVGGESHTELRHNIIAYHNSQAKSIGVCLSEKKADESTAAEIILTRNCLWDNNINYKHKMDHGSDILADPCFADPANGDYHLLPDSPCIGAGIGGEDLGAFVYTPPKPKRGNISCYDQALHTHLCTSPFAHVATAGLLPDLPAAWLRGAAAANRSLPLALARDLGLLLTHAPEQIRIEKPAHLPFERDTTDYLNFLERLTHHPLVRELPRWLPQVSDAVLAVILARLVEGLELPNEYGVPTGPAGIVFTQALSNELEHADVAQIWRGIPLNKRPDWGNLLPPEALARIESNLLALNREEIRFMVRFGPPLSGGPDPRDLMDILALTGLPRAARFALSQTIKLLPRVSSTQTVGGIQIYPKGGYEGLARKGSLDNLLLTELAWPDEIFLHRVLNHEALYYGRERPRERRRELAYLVVQLGWGLGGDGQVIARALVLALAQAMRQRGYEVLYSIAGSELTEPSVLNKPGQVGRMLYHKESGKVDEEKALSGVLKQLRSWREVYQGRQVLWVLSEYFDADWSHEHENHYYDLRAEAGQQAWFIHVGEDGYKRPPAAARYFESWRMLNTGIMHEERGEDIKWRF